VDARAITERRVYANRLRLRKSVEIGDRSLERTASKSHPTSFPKTYATADAVSHQSDYLAITTVVQELLSLGRSRLAAMRISSRGRSPRMIGQ
jgi:hypothetical protein